MSAANDFDFLLGSWHIHNRFLQGRLEGSDQWTEFDAESEVRPVLGGLGNIERYQAQREGRSVEGMTLRLFTPETESWSLYWADNVRAGVLQPPMVGRFEGGMGEFYGWEDVSGKAVRCRFLWDAGTAQKSPEWKQAFSADDGNTWETNWIMTFARKV